MLAKHIGEWKQELKPAAHGVKYFDPYPVGSLPGWIGQKQRNCLFKVTVLFVFFFSLVFVLFLFMKNMHFVCHQNWSSQKAIQVRGLKM